MQQLITQLPIAKHLPALSPDAMQKAANNRGRSLASIIKIALVGVLGYLAWVYVLPPVMMMLGKMAAAATAVVVTVFGIVVAPVVFKWINVLARKMHKAVIRQDPFMELERQEAKLKEAQSDARRAHGTIKRLGQDMEAEAKRNEDEARTLEDRVTHANAEAQRLKARVEALEQEHGPSQARVTDEYVHLQAEIVKHLSSARRVQSRLEQARNFVSKYGQRAAALRKVSHKLTLAEVLMDAKVEDFRASVDILKNDYTFASKTRQATDAAKAAMVFDKSWELEFAIEVVGSSIAEDIAASAGNFRDITTLAADFDMSNDEMFAQLDRLAEGISTGESVTPSARDYRRDDYVPTERDRAVGDGGFGEMF